MYRNRFGSSVILVSRLFRQRYDFKSAAGITSGLPREDSNNSRASINYHHFLRPPVYYTYYIYIYAQINSPARALLLNIIARLTLVRKHTNIILHSIFVAAKVFYEIGKLCLYTSYLILVYYALLFSFRKQRESTTIYNI